MIAIERRTTDTAIDHQAPAPGESGLNGRTDTRPPMEN